MRIREPKKEYEPASLENAIRDFWSRTQAYRRLKLTPGQGEKFYLAGHPLPGAGRTHPGLVRECILGDALLRFGRSAGRKVIDVPCIAQHSPGVETEVMKRLGIADADGIGEVGPERFAAACMEHAGSTQERLADTMLGYGIWLDWEKPALTGTADYVESVWTFLKEAHKKDLLRRALTVTPWCPRCRGPVSPAGISHQRRQVSTAYIKVPIKGRRDEYMLVWTASPWTFIGAMALAVAPDLNYARVAIREGGRKSTVIMLESQVDRLAGMEGVDAFEITGTVKGRELEGLEFFHPLMADIQYHKTAQGEWCHKVVALDSVQPGGTGVVYLAPGMSQSDFLIGQELDLPVFSPLDESGRFTTEAGVKYAGHDAEQAGQTVLSDLKAIRFLLHSTTGTRGQPVCGGCGTPLVHRASKQWLLRVGDVRDIILKTLKGVEWSPEDLGQEQAEMARNAVDWCVSGSGLWGIPMPVWECITDVCGHVEVVGRLKELYGGGKVENDLELHRPRIDSKSMECPKCGGLMKRVEDIVDPWLDSAVMTWALLGYPRKKKPVKDNWPADMVTAGYGRARHWLHYQEGAGIMHLGKVPFRRALALGRTLDADGVPVEESDADLADPAVLRGQHGADAVRLLMLSTPPWDTVRLEPGLLKHHRRVLNALWNSYVFAASYMSMDKWDPADLKPAKIKKDLRPEDEWLLSRVENLTARMQADLEAGQPHLACTRLEEFILDDLSRWYIRIVKERLWSTGDSQDKQAAYFALRECLLRLSVISSPFMPHMAEAIYQEMDGSKLSVSMVPWPKTDPSRLAEGMEAAMSAARAMVRAANRLRQENGIPVRWPLGTLTVSASGRVVEDAVSMFGHVIKRMVNVEKIDLVPENQEWAGQELIVVPNPNVIGKAYKLWESKIARMLKVLPAREVKAKIEAGEYTLGIEGQMIRILPDMVHFETKLPEGVISRDFEHGTLFLDSNMDDEMAARGFARQITRRIQQMRKEMALDPEEYIRLSMSMSQDLLDTLDPHLEAMAEAVRCNEMEIVEEVGDEEYVVEWPVEEETVVIGITSLDIKKSMSNFTCIPEVDTDLALALVEAGITDGQAFLETDRESLLRVPGMSHSRLRKIKEFFETPEDMRQTDTEQRCPLCDGVVEPGSVECQRCGRNLVGGEDLDVELIGGMEPELEEEEEEELPRERVKVMRRLAPEPEEVPEEVGPESDIVRMASRDLEERPEDLIAAEILRGVEDDRAGGEKVEELEVPAIAPAPEEDAMEPDVEIHGSVDAPDQEPAPEPGPVAVKKEIIGDDRERSIRAMAEVFGIKHSVARTLYSSGYDSVDALKNAREEDLREIKGIGKVTARRILQRISGQETKMCSLCNAIVPADAVTCERCGVRFADMPEPEAPEEPDTAGAEPEMEPKPTPEQLKSLKDMEKKLKKTPSDTDLLYSKAMMLKDAGRTDEALRTLDEALGIAPDDERLIKARDELAGREQPGEMPGPVGEPAPEVETGEIPDEAEEPDVEPEPEEEPGETPEAREVEGAAPSGGAGAKPEPEEEPGETPEAQEVEEAKVVMPGTEPPGDGEAPRGEGRVKLRESFTYLIPEERSVRSYALFREAIDSGTPGYCVTRTFPEKIRERYDLGDIPILWLSNVAKDDAVRPKDLEKLSLSLEEFLASKGGIILLDGIEYLITNNNFITVLKLVQSLRDQVAINRSILLLSVNPSTMDTHQINLLKREVDSVIE